MGWSGGSGAEGGMGWMFGLWGFVCLVINKTKGPFV